jgi:TPR repeat protein
MEYDIFISYSRADTQIVDQFVTKLTEAGYRVWIDREGIDGGDEFKTKIVRAIKGSALVVFFSSAKSNASKWTVKEISYSLKKEKPIIPVKLDETEYAESIDFDLIDIDFIQYHSNRPTSATERLLKSVSKKLGKSQPTKRPIIIIDTNLSPKKLYSRGISHYDKQEYEQAVEYFRKAAEHGHTYAQFYLGYCYNNGWGVAQDYKEAAKWYKKAAEQGDADAQFNLGVCYENGQGVAQDYNEAVRWYRKAAEQGDADAQCNLGYSYKNGWGVTQDYNEAVKWYRKAAEQGDATAQYNLGICYENGRGVAQDYNEAVKWYRKAAEQGYADAQNNLGGCYYNGWGVAQDYNEAVKWYRRAAEQGDADAQNNLGVCYENGQGVHKDLQKAIELYRKSVEQGNELAIKNLKRLGKWPK